jgi:fumarylacetoacetase
MHLPVTIGDYTDFYSSKQHAENIGKMFRDPSNPLLPNWLYIPVAYHGRASSVVVSGTPVRRPCGQIKAADAPAPVFGPSRMLDIELELGVIVGAENELGTPIPITEAHQYAFGMVLLNDWSARDIQRWEYEPLGPFLGKNFATSISPWVVPMAALEEFRVPLPVQEPPPLPYLQGAAAWGYDIELEIGLTTSQSLQETRIARSNFRTMYWSIAQQIAHHSSNGCNLKRGDLLGSGTVSGSDPGTYGSLLELTWRGTQPLTLASGEQRTFLQDGDTVQLRGYARGNGGYTVGFGEVTGTVLPSIPLTATHAAR